MWLIEVKRGKLIEEILQELSERYSPVEEMAADLGIQDSTAYKWLVQFGFEKGWVKPGPLAEQEGTGR